MSNAGQTAVTPRPAATVVILRDGREGLEAFMVVRHHEIDFASGALVFPGGKVDPHDADPAWDLLAPCDAPAPDRADPPPSRRSAPRAPRATPSIARPRAAS